MKKILFQGDSITDANRLRDEGFDFCTGHGYSTMVAAKIAFNAPGKFEFVNRGIGGDRVANLIERLNRDIINQRPDYMSILIGVNDVWAGIRFSDGTPAGLYETLYDCVIDESLKTLPDLKIAVLEPFVLKHESNEEYYEEFRSGVRARAAAAKRVAEKYNLTFIPLQAKLDAASEKTGDTSHWLRDGVHPTPAGHLLIADEWYEKFYKPVIEEDLA